MFSRRTKCLSIFLFLIACVWTTLGLFSVGYISTVNVNVLQGDDHGTKEGKVSPFKQCTDLCIFGEPSTTPTGVVEMSFFLEGGGAGGVAGEFESSSLFAKY